MNADPAFTSHLVGAKPALTEDTRDRPTCGTGALIRTASNTRQTGDVVEVPRGAVRDGLEGDDELLTEKGVEFYKDKQRYGQPADVRI